MSSNVGLSTPRGSGTSGYVQRNLSLLRPRDNAAPYPKDFDSIKHRQRQPDKEILEHDRKRAVEVKVFELRDKLEDEGLVLSAFSRILSAKTMLRIDEDEIEAQTSALRKKLLTEDEGGQLKVRGLKSHQVHELAKAKIEESERIRRALGIKADYEEGSHWRKQQERKEANAERSAIPKEDR